MAADRKYRYQCHHIVCRAFQPERTVQHQLSGADGRLPAGNAADGRAVPDLPETVHRRRGNDRRKINVSRARRNGLMKIITIQTKHTTYQIGIHPLGFLLHLYYGAKTEQNMSYLLQYYGIGRVWGDAALL